MRTAAGRLIQSLPGAVVFLAAMAGEAGADPRLLGTATLAPGTQEAGIAVHSEMMLSSVRLCVAGSSLEIYDVAVSFANGNEQEAHVRRTFAAGDCTPWIDLLGGLHRIKGVVFDYPTTTSSGPQPVVTLYGR